MGWKKQEKTLSSCSGVGVWLGIEQTLAPPVPEQNSESDLLQHELRTCQTINGRSIDMACQSNTFFREWLQMLFFCLFFFFC